MQTRAFLFGAIVILFSSPQLFGQQSYPYYGRNFVVHYFIDTYWVSQCGCPMNVGSESTLNLDISGKPLVVDVTTECAKSGQSNYFRYCTYDLNTADCYTDTNISWEPYNLTISGSASGQYCSSQKITLTAPSVYKSYVWQYSTQTGVWNTLSAFTGSTLAVAIQDIYGVNYTSHFNENIYFRYSVLGCSPISSIAGPYSFTPNPLSVSAYSATAPICLNGSDGYVTVSFNRSLLSGETTATDLFLSNSYITTTTTKTGLYGITYSSTTYALNPTSEPKYQSSGTTVINMDGGTYYALIESSYGGCGAPVFVPITVASGPRQPLTASLSITSNYNGAQISCNGSSDGTVSVSTNGGGSGSYAYSLDGGAFQSSNVFTGVSEGNHTVDVKDGCSTPTTASTNTVTLNAPSAVTVSSIVPSICNSSNNGQIFVNGSGGTGSYIFSVDGGSTFQASSSFTGLAAPNTYSIKIKDTNNCQSTISNVNLVGPIVAGSVVPPTCPSSSFVALSISGASGGSGNLKWEVHNASTNALVGSASVTSNSISVPSGTYYANVIDNNYPTCSTSTTNFTLDSPLAGTINQTSPINCYGQSTAALTVAPSGGTPSFSYRWSNGSTSQSVNSLPVGNYSVTITDSKSCSASASFTVSQPPPLAVGTPTLSDFNTYNISCKGGSNGSISVSPSGGTPSYTYLWSTGVTSKNISGLAAGNYSVAVTDSKGCGASKNFTLTEPLSSVSTSLQSKSDATCFGSNNGTIAATASGGVGAISFSKDNWASSQTSATFSALAPATYTIYARDQNNCSANTSPITISSPTALTIPSIEKNDPLCNGDANGSFTMSASGGIAPYQFSNGGSFTSTNTFSGLLAGAYVLSVKDGNGCTSSSPTQTLLDPALLVLSSSTIPQSCTSNTDGSITLGGSGGTSPYTFSADGGTSFNSTGIFTGLTSGVYSTALQDSHGCTSLKSVAVALQPALSSSIALISPINCFGQTTGGLSVNVTGGTAPYNYLWSNGSTTQNINALAAGSYSVNILDSRNCATTQSGVIDQPTELLLSYSNSDYNGFGVSCPNSTDGFINMSPSGGTPPYSYNWDKGATTKTISGLISGTYNVVVSDWKNCTSSLAVTLSAPPALNSSVNALVDVTCNGGNDGSVAVLTSGGVTDYTYSLDGKGWQSSPIFSSLTAGPYVVQTKDRNDCIASMQTNVAQPPAIDITIGQIQYAGCGLSNGSIQSSAIGGTGSLNYTWNDAFGQTLSSSANLAGAPSGIYSLTVSDQSQCSTSTTAAISNPNGPTVSIVNQIPTSCSYASDGQATVLITTGPTPYVITWSNGDSGVSSNRLHAGTNSVLVTDGNNCSTIQNFITSSPLAISLASQQSISPTCPGGADGSITVDASGGISPYKYFLNWKAGSNLMSNLLPGSYLVTIVDANSCTYSQKIEVPDVSPIVINVLNQQPPLCTSSSDGSVFVKASGGNGSFSYSWDNGIVGDQLNSVAAGVYSVTAIDKNNCHQQKAISLVAPVPISELLITSAALCHGGDSGTINVSSSGGAGGFAFSKNNGSTWQVQNLFENLTAGDYSIITKDKNGCSTSSQATIDEPPAIDIVISKTDPTCNQANGSAHATVVGGTGKFKYLWSNEVGQPFSVGPDLLAASSDVYTLKVVDANNCLSFKSIELALYPSPRFTVADVVSTTCSASSDGRAVVYIASVQSPYTISWSNGQTSIDATGLTPGANSVTVTDGNNCKFTKSFLVPSPLPITIISQTIIDPLCTGGSGSIQVTPTGGTGDFTFTWNGVIGTNTIKDIKAGPYAVAIRDNNGCILPLKYELIDPPVFEINLGSDKTICPNSLTSIGLNLPNATYQWSGPNNFVSSQGNVNVSAGGAYHLAVTNSDGCHASDDIIIYISNNLLKADFLTTSTAHIGDTLAIIDISWPTPDQIEWQLGDDAKVIHADHDYALITFSNSGDFKIGLIATQGGCKDEYYQTVSIDDLPRGGEAKRETGDVEISSVTAYPNPFVGKTNAKIELSDSGRAKLKVYSMVTNTLIMSHEFEDGKIHYSEIDFHGREAGLYIIVVESGSKTKAVRVIKL